VYCLAIVKLLREVEAVVRHEIFGCRLEYEARNKKKEAKEMSIISNKKDCIVEGHR
jgi:hypothetical protein